MSEIVVRLLIEPKRNDDPPTVWEGKPGERVTLSDPNGVVVVITMQEVVIR